MNKNIEKVIVSTAIAKIINENYNERNEQIIFNVRLTENDIKKVSKSVESGAFDYLKPIEVSTSKSLVIFKANRSDFPTHIELKEYFIIACNQESVNLFDIKYNTDSIIQHISNITTENDIKDHQLDKVLETSSKYHFKSKPNHKIIDVYAIKDKDSFSFSADNDDSIISLLKFVENSKSEFRNIELDENPIVLKS